ncbi:MAG: T9SS type A sorting domain-containing protein, partial [Bacteroidetes bacterium]|nr:T9SS type A sorting domain-containing protein [Bacteroidota bacterium]
PAYAAAERPWNNATFPTASAMMMHENLVNEKNEATGYSLVAQSHFDKERLYGDDSGNNTGVFPDLVTKSAFIVNNTGMATFDILGLDSEKRYNFVFFGSNILGSHGGYTYYSIGEQSVALPIQSNVDRTVQLNGIQPAADGKASISVRGDDNYFKGGYLNAMVIEEYDADKFLRPGRLKAYATSRTTIALRWEDKSHQETGFEIERRQLPDGDFTLVNTLEANTTTYLDENLSENTAYEYRIRAVSDTLHSTYSAAIQASTLKYQVFINANYNTDQNNTNAGAPWNNLDQDTKTDFIWSNLKDDDSEGTGISLKIIQNFDGNGDIGADANNSGIYPDQVIKSFYFTEAGRTAKLGISGLDDNLVYNFRFLGSSVFAGGENGVTEYRIGNKKRTLDVQDNISNTAVIRDVQPENGIVYLEMEAGAQESHFAEEGGTGRYGYLNSLVIEARARQQETLPAADPEDPEDPEEPEDPEDPENPEEPPVVTGVDQTLVPEKRVTIYPNPVQHELFIEYYATIAGPCYLQITDLMGRTIHTQELTAKANKNIWKLTLENRSMKNGMYLLKIRTADFNSEVIRFMKH